MKLKRLLAVLCCLSLFTTLLVPAAFAADEFVYEYQTEFYDFYDEASGLAYKIVEGGSDEVMVGAYYELGKNTNGNISYRYHYTGEKTVPATVGNNDTTYTVVGIDQIAFQDTSVTAVNMPTDSESFQTIDAYAFRGCKSLKSITIPASVTKLGSGELDGSVFEGAGLESITFAENSKLDWIGPHTFAGCTSLSALTLPDSVTYIGAAAFAGCKALSSVTIPANAELAANVFGGIANVDPYYYSTANGGTGNVFFAEGSEYQIKDGILYDADSVLTRLELQANVTVPEGIKYIGDGAFKMFGGDSTLKSITFPSTLESIGVDAFNGNSGLTEIIIPSSVTSLGANAFMNCTKLASIIIEAELTEIPGYAFSGSAITSITLPETIESIGKNAFDNCKSLTSIIIPDSVTEIGNSAFNKCAELVTVELPSRLTSIGERAFSGCVKLSDLQIPETVTSLGVGAFINCRALNSIVVPDGVSAIEKQTFANCSALETLILPSGIKTVGPQALQGALADNHVLVMQGNTPPTFDTKTFGNNAKLANVLIPTAAKSAYTADGCLLKDYVKDDSLYGLTMNDRSVKAAATGATGNTLTFTADVPTGATLSVASSDTAVATAEVGEDGKTITVTSVAQGEAKITAKITLTASNFVLLEKTATVTVLGADKEPAIVVPAAPEAKNEASNKGTDEEKTLANNVETALKPADGSAGLTVEEEKLSAAANTVVTQNTVTAENGKEKLGAAGIGVSGATVSIVVQPYMEVVIRDVDITEATTTLTLEITPMYQTVATTADLNKTNPDEIVVKKSGETNNANAVVVNSGKLTVTEPVEIRVPLPEGFATGEQLFVTHIKSNDRSYVYTGTVADNILTFTNPHGFSTFTMSTSNPTVAKIGDIGYTSLQDALDEAANGSTVDVLQDGLSGNITQTKTITLRNTTDGQVTATINGAAYTLEAEATQAVSYTRPSGGGDSATYAVSVDSAKNGAVSASPQGASKGATVTLTVVPDEGYVLDELSVTDKNGDSVQLTDKGDGKYTFTMPASKVSVKAGFVKTSTAEGLPFTDVLESDWHYDAVNYVYTKGIMNGTGATTFAPNIATTRGMIVTILYRLEGAPAVSGQNPFDDVAAGAYYENAVTWAAANGIVGGYGDGKFGPNDPITREQMVTILYRYAQMKGMDVSVGENTNILSYDDAFDVAEWAIPAFQWACGEGIVSGTSDATLAPQGSATRAQVAVILMRFCENIAQ